MKLIFALLAVFAVDHSFAIVLPCTDVMCFDLYDPVCAQPQWCAEQPDCGPLRTFGNSCNMGQYNCGQGRKGSELKRINL